MIIGEADEGQLRELAASDIPLQFIGDESSAPDIGDLHVPTDVVGGHKGAQAFDSRLTGDHDFAGAFLIFIPEIGPTWFAGAFGIAPTAGRHGEFTVVTLGNVVSRGIVPEETSRSIR